MEKKWSLVFILIVVVSLLLYFTGVTSADSGNNAVEILELENPDLIGMYWMSFSDGSFDDYHRDQWKNRLQAIMDFERCVVPIEGRSLTLLYKPGVSYWKLDTNIWGKTCYRFMLH